MCVIFILPISCSLFSILAATALLFVFYFYYNSVANPSQIISQWNLKFLSSETVGAVSCCSKLDFVAPNPLFIIFFGATYWKYIYNYFELIFINNYFKYNKIWSNKFGATAVTTDIAMLNNSLLTNCCSKLIKIKVLIYFLYVRS